MAEWRNRQSAWGEERQELKCRARRAEAGKRNIKAKLEGMRAQLSDATVGTSGFQGEIRDLHSQLEASE